MRICLGGVCTTSPEALHLFCRGDLAVRKNPPLRIGTCSWKYESWQGIVYSQEHGGKYLEEYAEHFPTVEVDQWFWSLFAGNKVVLPKAAVVREYAASVPEGFLFGIKVPNSLTLTHHYRKGRSEPLVANPHFLSVDLMLAFLESIAPLGKKIGPLNFQFEYLNKQKISGLAEFLDRFGVFIERLPGGFSYGLETRNPNFLQQRYFDFLEQWGLHHVFLQGYYMPSIFEVYGNFGDRVKAKTVIRLHGAGREENEAKVGGDWSRIVTPRDAELHHLVDMLGDLGTRGVETFLFVNNHFEGSAPRTIARIERLMTPAKMRRD